MERIVIDALAKAREADRLYVMFVHGQSTSRPGQTTARSVVRRFMRSPRATLDLKVGLHPTSHSIYCEGSARRA